jgi:coenzyme F420-reducing hydrogenase alpha subunit
MARDHGDAVRRGLRVKKAGNDIVNFIGGREIHPINVCVGGFYRVPKKREFAELTEKLKWGRDAAREVVRWVSQFDFPDRQRDYTFVALRHPSEYPYNEGRIASNRGLDIPASEYDAHFKEIHVARSTALQSRLDGEAYLVGPLARYALNFDKLSPLAQEAAREAGLDTVCRNPYKSIVVRAVETLYAFDEALRIIENYEEPEKPAVPLEPRAGTGYGATEAPRGLLYHRYSLEADGTIATAQIVPPTSQNQASVEADLTNFVEGFLDLPDKELQHRCEQTVRNYDPCISCATHFLKLDIDRG